MTSSSFPSSNNKCVSYSLYYRPVNNDNLLEHAHNIGTALDQTIAGFFFTTDENVELASIQVSYLTFILTEHENVELASIQVSYLTFN